MPGAPASQGDIKGDSPWLVKLERGNREISPGFLVSKYFIPQGAYLKNGETSPFFGVAEVAGIRNDRRNRLSHRAATAATKTWGGRPRPRRTPLVRLLLPSEQADQGVCRGPGGPPHRNRRTLRRNQDGVIPRRGQQHTKRVGHAFGRSELQGFRDQSNPHFAGGNTPLDRPSASCCGRSVGRDLGRHA
jgi:hypothetical protein